MPLNIPLSLSLGVATGTGLMPTYTGGGMFAPMDRRYLLEWNVNNYGEWEKWRTYHTLHYAFNSVKWFASRGDDETRITDTKTGKVVYRSSVS